MEGELGARPLEGRGVSVINGVSWIMFDVIVPIVTFDVIFKAVNPLFCCSFSRRN
jgi:hypothetical protein